MRYLLDHDIDLAAFAQDLCKKRSLTALSPLNIQRQFMDSFDWRLYKANVALELELAPGHRKLLWKLTDNSSPDLVFPVPRAKLGFAADLREGPLKDRLAPLLEMRKLIAQLTITTHRQPLCLRDQEGKTLLTLNLEHHQLQDADGQKVEPLPPCLTVEAVRGYDNAFAVCIDYLENKLQLSPSDTSLFQDGLVRLGRYAGDYSSKVKLVLEPSLPAAETTRTILRTLYTTMLRNESGTIQDIDSEFLHDFRVAGRRTRSALSQIKNVLPQTEVDIFKSEFAWLGQITGPTRDMDVYLLDFEKYRNLLPELLKPALDPLKTFLTRHQRSEQQKMVRALRSKRYRDLKKNYTAFLEQETPDSEPPAKAQQPTKKTADQRIWKTYCRLVEEGRAIHPESPAEDLHELRKTGKKLRYLMEFFQSLYPAEDIKALIKSLKLLQENLGNFQDLEVQTHALQGFANQMQQEKIGSVDTFLAMGALCLHLNEQQQQARTEFAERFAAFDDDINRDAFQQLFHKTSRSSMKSKG